MNHAARSLVTIAAVALSLTSLSFAQGSDHHGHAQSSTADRHQAAAPPANAHWVEGEVRRIDREQGKLTLRHGPIPNLDMGAMSMVFRTTDPRMLDTLKEGDKVKFTADRIHGVFTVTSIRAGH